MTSEPSSDRQPIAAGPLRQPAVAMLRLSGEISTKARRTRARFQKRLVRNIRDAMRSEGLRARVDDRWSRLYVTADDARLFAVLTRVFGISSYSVLEAECEASLEAIVETGHRTFANRVRGHRFAVRARRSGTHHFGSSDVMKELGAALNAGATVDLSNPDIVVRVEVRDERALLFSDRIPGAGGLPVGVQGRSVCLISGGFDSAVAAWMMLRRGIRLDYVFCNLGGSAYRRMVLEVAKVLADRWSYGTHPRLHVVDFEGVVEAMRRSAKPAYLQVVLKRLMYRTASRIAARTGAQALVTGESVGQVSSQTLKNLRAIEDASDFPVLRPLVGFDKEEIVARARRIGTYELSARIREYCAVAPVRPVTAATPAAAGEQEALVDPGVLNEALAAAEELDLRALVESDIVGQGLFVAQIPADAEVVDTRDQDAFQAWHWPAARHWDLEELTRDYQQLDRDRTYVFYCAEGLRTAHLVERMQAHGYEAYSFRGGVRALRRHAAERDRKIDPTITSGRQRFDTPRSSGQNGLDARENGSTD